MDYGPDRWILAIYLERIVYHVPIGRRVDPSSLRPSGRGRAMSIQGFQDKFIIANASIRVKERNMGGLPPLVELGLGLFIDSGRL